MLTVPSPPQLVWEVTLRATAEGTVEMFNETSYKAGLATLLSVDESNVRLFVSSASVLVVAVVTSARASDAALVLDELESMDATTLSLALGVSLTSVEPPTLAEGYAGSNPLDGSYGSSLTSGSSGDDSAAALYAVIGVLVVSVTAAIFVVRRRRLRGSGGKPADVMSTTSSGWQDDLPSVQVVMDDNHGAEMASFSATPQQPAEAELASPATESSGKVKERLDRAREKRATRRTASRQPVADAPSNFHSIDGVTQGSSATVDFGEKTTLEYL